MALKVILFAYKNHRGLESFRHVTPIALEWLPNPGYGYKPGWFLRGYCHDRKAERSFALDNIILDGQQFTIPLGEKKTIKLEYK